MTRSDVRKRQAELVLATNPHADQRDHARAVLTDHRRLEIAIGLLPDCDHPTSRGVCPSCVADGVLDEIHSLTEALGAALVLLDASDLRSVIDELERLDRIGNTSFDAINAADRAWLSRHPLKPLGDAIPALVQWLRDFGGDQ